MKISLLFLITLLSFSVFSQKSNPYFEDKELTTIGAYYYPEHWDPSQWDRDLKKIADMGFEFTHFAEFAWAQLEPEEGKYDFEWLDKALEIAAKYDLEVIMCTSTATPPVWISRKHPEILVTHEDGTKMDHGARQHASFSNETYKEYAFKMIEKLAEHYGNDSRIMGWQLDNEPRSTVDFSADATKRFRAWLKSKYGNIEALNQAWGTNFWSGTYSKFDEINIPQHEQWGMNLYQRLDHSRFCDDETSTFLNEQAKIIKQYSSKEQWVTTNFIPMYDARFIGNSDQLDFITYTRYMVYGEHRGIGRDGYRIGEYSRIAMANDYFRPLSPLYGVMELQPGQVNWGEINSQPLPGAVRLWLWSVFSGGSKFTCTYRFRAPIYGYEQYHYGIVGPDGVTPTRGGKEYQQFIEEINLLRKNATLNKIPEAYQNSKTAILFDPDNTVAIEQNKQTTEWNTEAHVLKYYKALKSFGAPVDFIRDTMNFNQYPVIVVPAYQQMSKSLISKLENYVENGGNLVMTSRTGHQNELGHLWQAQHAEPIYKLIGAEIEFYDLPRPFSPVGVKMDGKTYEWTSWGDVLKPNKNTESWASYHNAFYEAKSAATFHKLGEGTVSYCGVDTKSGELEKEFLKKVYNKIEISVKDYPKGIIVEYRDGFGIAMNYSDKVYNLELNDKTKFVVGGNSVPVAGVSVWMIK